MSTGIEYPEHWCTARLERLLAEPLRNGHSARESKNGNGIRTLTLTAVTLDDFSERNTKLTVADPAKVSDLWLRDGDILVERSNTPELVGTANLYAGPDNYAIFSDLLIRVRLAREVDARLVTRFLHSGSARAYFQRRAQGIAGSMPKISQGTVEQLEIPVPPIEEQKRIVAAIESYFTRLDDAVATLEQVQRNLKRYRASVLKAAVEGRLVPTEAELARAEGRSYEPASVLLTRILAERRRRWEEAELAKMTATGKAPKDDKWKAKYVEPVAPDTSELPELPEGWCWTSLDAFLVDIEAGKNFKCDERPPQLDEVGVVKVSAVTWGTFDEDESKTCRRHDQLRVEHLIRPGDFLISRANTVELVGACVIVGSLRRKLMLSDKILRLQLVGPWEKWLLWALRCRWGRDEIERLATGNQESMRNVSQASIRGIRVPLPPAAEAERILIAIHAALEMADSVAGATGANTTRLARLRQSILKWAFEGRLVDQDPTDEPASVLLDRIRAEREAASLEAPRRSKAKSGPGGARRTRRNSSENGRHKPSRRAIRELDVVVLAKPVEQLGLEAGARGTVVLVHSGGAAFDVEFLDSGGATRAVTTLAAGDIESVARAVSERGGTG